MPSYFTVHFTFFQLSLTASKQGLNHFLALIFYFLHLIGNFKEHEWTNMSLPVYYTHERERELTHS